MWLGRFLVVTGVARTHGDDLGKRDFISVRHDGCTGGLALGGTKVRASSRLGSTRILGSRDLR